jgi:hypothetical protein
VSRRRSLSGSRARLLWSVSSAPSSEFHSPSTADRIRIFRDGSKYFPDWPPCCRPAMLGLGEPPMDRVLKVIIAMLIVSVTAAGWTVLVQETAWLISN